MWLQRLGDVGGEDAELEGCEKRGAGRELALRGERLRDPGGTWVEAETRCKVG